MDTLHRHFSGKRRLDKTGRINQNGFTSEKVNDMKLLFEFCIKGSSRGYLRVEYFCRFGQFLVSTLPNFNQSEKGVALGFTNTLVEISKPSFDEDSQGNCESS